MTGPDSPGRPRVHAMSSGQVTRTLLLVALIAMVIGGLAYQLGAGDTAFDRPGEVVLLFVDIGPVLWFAAAPIVLTALRFQALDARIRLIVIVAFAAAAIAIVARTALVSESLTAAVLDPFTLGLPVWVAAAALFIRARARRFARGSDDGITLIGMALGFAVAAVGVALGAVRLVVVGPLAVPGVPVVPVAEAPTTTFLTAASLGMVAGLFWLVDHTRMGR